MKTAQSEKNLLNRTRADSHTHEWVWNSHGCGDAADTQLSKLSVQPIEQSCKVLHTRMINSKHKNSNEISINRIGNIEKFTVKEMHKIKQRTSA